MPEPIRTGSQRRELTVAAAAVAAAATVILLARGIRGAAHPSGDLGPQAWPTAVGVFGVALALILLLAEYRGATDPVDEVVAGGWRRVGVVVTVFVCYGVAWTYLDFRVCTVGLLAALVAVTGGRGWKALLLFPVLLTALVYVLFDVLLKVPL